MGPCSWLKVPKLFSKLHTVLPLLFNTKSTTTQLTCISSVCQGLF